MLPPKPDELILPIYSFEALNASEEMGKCKGRPNRAEGCPHPGECRELQEGDVGNSQSVSTLARVVDRDLNISQ
jgi:hypothetical protein